MAQLKTSNTKKKRNNKYMCEKEELEFNKIKKARDNNLKKLEKGLITPEDFRKSCDKLIARLDALKAKYD